MAFALVLVLVDAVRRFEHRLGRLPAAVLQHVEKAAVAATVTAGNLLASVTLLDDQGQWVADFSQTLEVFSGLHFPYTGTFQEFTAPRTGLYRLEAWGAAANKGSLNDGAYTAGTILLQQGDTLYAVVGSSWQYGSYNGGGVYGYHAAGGATDWRLDKGDETPGNPLSLNSRLMVAAGGGVSHSYGAEAAGAAGGLTSDVIANCYRDNNNEYQPSFAH